MYHPLISCRLEQMRRTHSRTVMYMFIGFVAMNSIKVQEILTDV